MKTSEERAQVGHVTHNLQVKLVLSRDYIVQVLMSTFRKAVNQPNETIAETSSSLDFHLLSLLETGKGRHSPFVVKKMPERIRPKPTDSRLFDPKQSIKGSASPYRSTLEPSSEWSVEANRSQFQNASKSHTISIDTSFIQAHSILFGKLSLEVFNEARTTFLSQLNNQIGRVTAKSKE